MANRLGPNQEESDEDGQLDEEGTDWDEDVEGAGGSSSSSTSSSGEGSSEAESDPRVHVSSGAARFCAFLKCSGCNQQWAHIGKAAEFSAIVSDQEQRRYVFHEKSDSDGSDGRYGVGYRRAPAVPIKWTREVEEQYVQETHPKNVVFASLVLSIVNANIILVKALYYFLFPAFMFFVPDPSCYESPPPSTAAWASRVIEFVVLASLLVTTLVNSFERSVKAHYTVVTIFFVYLIFVLLPPLAPTCADRQRWMQCERISPMQELLNASQFLMPDMDIKHETMEAERLDCNLQGYTLMQLMMCWILLTPITIPDYRLMRLTWLWIWIVYLGSTVVLRNLPQWPNYHSAADVVICTVFLTVVHGIATSRKWYIEKGLRKKYLMALEEKENTKKMFVILQYMLPNFVIVPMLKNEVIAEQIDCASILFIKFVDFDVTARRLSPAQLLEFLNQYFTAFDDICKAEGVLKIETVGEEYVCAVGVTPDDREEASLHGHHTILARLIRVALEILRPVESGREDAAVFQMGLHTGPVVAGVIGHKLPRFRLFGDTINMAARMMQKGLPGEVQYGDETRKELQHLTWVSSSEPRKVKMKGRDEDVTVYHLLPCGSETTRPSPMSVCSTVSRNTSWSARTMRSRPQFSGAKIPHATSLPSNGFLRTSTGGSSAFRLRGLLKLLLQPRTVETGKLDDFEEVLEEMRDGVHDVMPRRCRPGCDRFEGELEASFRRWFHRERICKKLDSRLNRQLLFLLVVTSLEAAYLLFLRTGVAGVNAFRIFLACRAVCVLIILTWRLVFSSSDHIQRSPRTSQFLLLVSCCVVAIMVFISYNCMNAIEDAVDHAYLAELIILPMYTMVTVLHPFLFEHHCYFVVLAVVLIVTQLNFGDLYFSKLGTLLFIMNSGVHAFESWNVEINLRAWFKCYFTAELTNRRVHSILHTLMPPMVLEELQSIAAGDALPSHRYLRATLAQSDLCGFTKLASTKKPAEVVEFIGDLFGIFDDLTDRYEIYKVETVGDAYIAGQAENPLTYKNSALSVIRFALEMIKATRDWSRRKGYVDDDEVSCRVGVHSGECIGGIVGSEMQRYHLFGQLTTDLELLESTAPRGRVQASRSCKEAVELLIAEHGVQCDVAFHQRTEQRLQTSKGEVHTYAEVGGVTYIVEQIFGEG